MSIEAFSEKPKTYLLEGQTVRIPESRLNEHEEGFANQTTDGWTIFEIGYNFGKREFVRVEKEGTSKNIPLKELEAANPEK